MTTDTKTLRLKFHGRIIDSLGIQMYQSPVAAIAELIANAWDADATAVDVTVPDALDELATITIKDNGIGMTFDDCQNLYLEVGRNRREEEHSSKTAGGRPCLGRKGLGKFAGFGIADVVQVTTTSEKTGERTTFRLDLNELRSTTFVSTEGKQIDVVESKGPDESARGQHGTIIRLLALKLSQRKSAEALARQMARRFLVAQQSSPFKVTINGLELPQDSEIAAPEFEFPRDYREDERPDGLTVADDWGREKLSDGNVIRWRIRFTPTPIGIEEFRGVSVFCGIKVAQTPFYFQLSGGLGGQHGQQYMSGIVQADYLDQGPRDVITTERQRINWEDPTAAPLLEWGQERLKGLLALWQKRRAEAKVETINNRLANFSERLGRLNASEARTVRRALTRIASIGAIDQPQFEELAHAILTAWEAGRLRAIIEDVARIDEMDAGVLMSVLAEHQVLSALHVAEVVKLKVEVINGLRHRIADRDLENAIRNYIARYPWLISPRWETFKVERRIGNLVEDALEVSGIASDIGWEGRVDLALSSGQELLILEFMRPGLTVDRNHMDRFQHYIDILRSNVQANSSLQLTRVTGMLVADNLNRKAENMQAIERMNRDGMMCTEWRVLLPEAAAQWHEFLEILVERAPDDTRVRALTDGGAGEGAEGSGANAESAS